MLEKILKKYEKNIIGIIQVGANVGQELKLLSSFEKNIYLFEPIKNIYQKLEQESKKYKNVFTFNIALGDINTTKSMYISKNNDSASSSILEPSLHLKYFPEVKFKKEEEVNVKRFDSYTEVFIANFLILDVQGYELNVIRGFGEEISKISYIFTEFSLEKLYKNSVVLKDLDLFLKNLGFLRIMTKTASNKPQGDALYVKRKTINLIAFMYYIAKSKFQTGKFYLFFNFLFDFKKVKFVIKNKLKF